MPKRPTMNDLCDRINELTATVEQLQADLRGPKRTTVTIRERQLAEAALGLILFHHNRSAITRLSKATLIELVTRLERPGGKVAVWRWLHARPEAKRVTRTAFYRFTDHYAEARRMILFPPPLLKGDVS